MQSANQMQSMNQMHPFIQMIMLKQQLLKIISPEDQNKDEKFILNKYPRVAQMVFENDAVFEDLKKTLEIEKNQPEDERKVFWKRMDMLCASYMKAPAYKNGNKEHNGYKICCEMADYCSFYKQTWFFIVCGAVGFLLLVAIAGGVFFIIRRKNKKKIGGNNKKEGSKP
ncbi:hypothetical protein GCK72_003095 [Caenorhabditis remanei]|uniref:Uncharacterized protein n=1 Tax=Caenorhabditis remanei TaxID=31234 RepID=A0A6A5HU54_CAERE|nr:hypothetical protein GCK72_003095 [Caenorhabditis remanei]KAF1771269.1 hypothetical protein GCK72_003095 [Caenorhabditis remanei]